MSEAKEYMPWANAGGPNECKHGYAQGIRCPDCDNVRPATPEELVEQGQNLGNNYKPGPRQTAQLIDGGAGKVETLFKKLMEELFDIWDQDQDMKVGKWLRALSGNLPGYSPEIDRLLQALKAGETAEEAWKRGYIAGADHAASDLGATLFGIHVPPYTVPGEKQT